MHKHSISISIIILIFLILVGQLTIYAETTTAQLGGGIVINEILSTQPA